MTLAEALLFFVAALAALSLLVSALVAAWAVRFYVADRRDVERARSDARALSDLAPVAEDWRREAVVWHPDLHVVGAEVIRLDSRRGPDAA